MLMLSYTRLKPVGHAGSHSLTCMQDTNTASASLQEASSFVRSFAQACSTQCSTESLSHTHPPPPRERNTHTHTRVRTHTSKSERALLHAARPTRSSQEFKKRVQESTIPQSLVITAMSASFFNQKKKEPATIKVGEERLMMAHD